MSSHKKSNLSQPSPARDPGKGSVGDAIASEPKPKRERWLETRDLLAQALADWDSSEKIANETLKEAEAEKSELDSLLRQLKTKLEELSK